MWATNGLHCTVHSLSVEGMLPIIIVNYSGRILGVACIMDKVREVRLRWFGHVQRREEEDSVRRILEADVHGQQSRGRQRKRWIDVVKYNMEDLRLDLMDVENRAEWRRTRVADPWPEGFNPAWRREREREREREVSIYQALAQCRRLFTNL